MEKRTSSYTRVVGVSPAEERELLGEAKGFLEDQDLSKYEILTSEKEKTEEDLELISLANALTDVILKQHGLESFPIPAEAIHLIKKKAWGGKSGGYFRQYEQAIIMPDTEVNIRNLNVLVHELLHFKSYLALQKTSGDDWAHNLYRLGLEVHDRFGEHVYFKAINEAVTESLAERALKESSDHPLLREEVESTRQILSDRPFPTDVPEYELFTDHVIFAEIEKIRKSVLDDYFQRPSKDQAVYYTTGYKKERRALSKLVTRLYEKNRHDFSSEEAVFNLFAQGMMTGKILPLGRLIDSTFGKGAFRRLGEVTDENYDIDAVELHIASL